MHWTFVAYSSKCDCTHWCFIKVGILTRDPINGPLKPVGTLSKKAFNLSKIVMKFSMNLKKTRWKFEGAMETIREKN